MTEPNLSTEAFISPNLEEEVKTETQHDIPSVDRFFTFDHDESSDSDSESDDDFGPDADADDLVKQCSLSNPKQDNLFSSLLFVTIACQVMSDYAETKLKHSFFNRSINDIVKLTKTRRTSLGSGTYGSVLDSCLTKSGECFKLEDLGWCSNLALKLTITTRPEGDKLFAFGYNDRFVGNRCPYREALIGRALFWLTQMKITPHFTLSYIPIGITDIPGSSVKEGLDKSIDMLKTGKQLTMTSKSVIKGVAILMNKASHDISYFIVKKLTKYNYDLIPYVTRVIVIQLLQGLLAASIRYGFSHNDLHRGNLMVTDVFPENVYYKTDRVFTEAGRYKIPNFGMNWSIIDYGFGTMEWIKKGETSSIWKQSGFLLAGMLYRRDIKSLFPDGDQAGTDFLDVVRILMAIKQLSDYVPDIKFQMNVVVDEIMQNILDITSMLKLKRIKDTVRDNGFFTTNYVTDETFWKTHCKTWTADANPLRYLFHKISAPFEMHDDEEVPDYACFFDTDGTLDGVELNEFDKKFVGFDLETLEPSLNTIYFHT